MLGHLPLPPCNPLPALPSPSSTPLAGAVYETLAYQFNLGRVSNAVALWLGMEPADIFV